MRITGLSLLVWVCFGLLAPAFGQTPREVKISNSRVEQEGNRYKIIYDIENVTKNDSIFIQANSPKGVIIPKSVTGNVGKGIQPGKDKVIYWDIKKDDILLEDEIQIVFKIKVAPPQGGGGPANALLSVLVPGLGNVMVQPNHRIGFRPLITVAYGGLLIYGLSQRSQANKQYQLYQSQTLEEQAEPYYTKANQARHQYLIATRAAAVILVADVIYTAIKGSSNLKKRSQLSLGFQHNTPLIGFRYSL